MVPLVMVILGSFIAFATESNYEEQAKEPKSTTSRDAYLKMLSSGSSDYPIELLKKAGVDMTSSAPFQAAIQEMNKIMDEMEILLKRPSKEKKQPH